MYFSSCRLKFFHFDILLKMMVHNLQWLILHYSHVTSLIFCFISNITLIVCLYTEERPQLRLYRNVLYVQCCSDMVAGVLYYFGSARFFLIDEIFYFVSTNPVLEHDIIYLFCFEIQKKYFGFVLYLFAMGIPIAVLPLNYYFRYLQLCR